MIQARRLAVDRRGAFPDEVDSVQVIYDIMR